MHLKRVIIKLARLENSKTLKLQSGDGIFIKHVHRNGSVKHSQSMLKTQFHLITFLIFCPSLCSVCQPWSPHARSCRTPCKGREGIVRYTLTIFKHRYTLTIFKGSFQNRMEKFGKNFPKGGGQQFWGLSPKFYLGIYFHLL